MPAVLLLFWVLPSRLRNGVMSTASLVFYAYGAHSFVLLLVGMVVLNYGAGLLVSRPDLTRRGRRILTASAVAADLAVLATWKYGGFLASQVAAADRLLGGHARPVAALALPIGISFYTFHNISYVVDIARGTCEPLRKPLTYLTYITMFPQLVAGPIVRYHEIADQLGRVPTDRVSDLAAGFPRFCLGLAKKVVVADQLAPVAQAVFNQPGQPSTATAWLGAVAYTLQIYFDFSGYSDMAIGLARMFGLQLPENFNRPYASTSVTDFWRRWHMSLSRWFRDYLYIPLGGNRCGSARTYLHLTIVFLLVGLWHGAAWTFVAWGAYHGTWLVIERRSRGVHRADGGAVLVGRAKTLLVVIVGWVFFRSPSLHAAGKMLWAMGHPAGLHLSATASGALDHETTLVLILASSAFLLPRSVPLGQVIERGTGAYAALARVASVAVAAPFAAVLVVAGTFSPFLYYQF